MIDLSVLMQKTVGFVVSNVLCEGCKLPLVTTGTTTSKTERFQGVCCQPEGVLLDSPALLCN